LFGSIRGRLPSTFQNHALFFSFLEEEIAEDLTTKITGNQDLARMMLIALFLAG